MDNYSKYRWFFTSSGKLVVGGKSAEQNEEVIKKLSKGNFIVMHTSSPGSPFSFIISEPKKVSEKDLEEVAIFTASFSRAWREGKKTAEIDVFQSNQLYKDKSMKLGTWGVVGRIDSLKAQLKLYLGLQKGVIRAIPFKFDKKSHTIIPGKTEKERFARELKETLFPEKNTQEILIALPTGGFKLIK